jgi:replicative DNA helicase Mcm
MEVAQQRLISSELVLRFDKFFSQESQKRRLEIVASKYPQVKSADVDLDDVYKFDHDLADEILEQPDVYREAAEEAVRRMGVASVQENEFSPHVRFFNTPDVPKFRPMVLELGADHLNRLISIDGTVSSIGDIKPHLKRAVWRCKFCEATTETFPDKTEPVQPPFFCESCTRKDGKANFELDEKASWLVNKQRSEIQDAVERLRGNVPAVHVELWLEDDLTNRIAPGDKVILSGILRLKPLTQGRGKSSVYGKFFEVMHVHERELEFEEIEITREDEVEILKLGRDPKLFEKIVASIAPSLYGYTELKQSIALQLFGGTPGKVLPDGERIRSDMHILMIGDPGCLVADERVALGNGAIAKMGELGTKHLQEINVSVLTGEGGRKRDVATVFHKYPNQPVMEVITESGKSIRGTHNHPLLCVEGDYGRIQRNWKRLDELKVGDKLAAVTSIPCTITAPVATGFKPLAYKGGPKFSGKLPARFTPDLAALSGYFLGDGWATETEVGFVVAEPEKDIIPELERKCVKLFGISPKKVSHKLAKGRTVPLHYFGLYSKDIANNLKFLREKRVPALVLASGNRVLAEFLKWLFEADGTVFDKGRGRRVVGLKAKNIELLRDVQMLLLRFAIHSRIDGNALLIRRGNDIIKFTKKIGFASQKKRKKLESLAAKAKGFARTKGQRVEKIVKIIRHPPEDVFDVEVPKGHRFIANGIISHNTGKSTMLEYVSNIAPKSVVVSGGSSTGVGLTAAAEKEEGGEGWVLKAGAMVLANGGIVAIDELDKMNENDRGAMHQAMEQQYISIAKAGIVTEFQTKTAVLAAANPKLGRFDPNTPPAQQFNISPALLSRFDLIFTMRDVLDESRDKAMASHILEGHRIAASKEAPPKSSITVPLIEQTILRKYIAYARRHSAPKLTKEASEKIRDYYVQMRRIGQEQNTFPITARQIEGLIRLSEASAKMRLSATVDLQDAQRAVDLQNYVLNEVFIDRETGKLDSDVVNLGQSKNRLDRVRTVLNIIRDIEREYDLAPIDDVVKEARNYNIDEFYARNLIDELLRKGELYGPKAGYVKSARQRE